MRPFGAGGTPPYGLLSRGRVWQDAACSCSSGVVVLSKFSRAYPLLSAFVWSGLLAVLYLLYRRFVPDGHALPVLSGAAFVFVGTFNAFLVDTALYVERSVRRDPPLWRTRYALASAAFFFVSQVIVTGTELPSNLAAMQLGGGLVSGALMARLVRHDEMVVGDGAFDLERPVWTTRVGGFVTTWAAFAVVGVAGAATVFAPRTASGLFAVILLMPVMLPFGVKSRTRWHEGRWVVLLSTLVLVLGLFAAG